MKLDQPVKLDQSRCYVNQLPAIDPVLRDETMLITSVLGAFSASLFSYNQSFTSLTHDSMHVTICSANYRHRGLTLQADCRQHTVGMEHYVLA